MFNGDREINTDYRATLLKCLQCDNIELPALTYSFSSGMDLEIAEEVQKILELKDKA